jgi:hypothetical protein
MLDHVNRHGLADSRAMSDEWRVEVELSEEGHGMTLGDRLRSVDLDDAAKERLGGRLIVTREGARMFIYTGSEEAAREAERVVSELTTAEGLDAKTQVTHWDPGDHEWEDILGHAVEHERSARTEDDEDTHHLPHPAFVVLGAHKPEILRDLGL